MQNRDILQRKILEKIKEVYCNENKIAMGSSFEADVVTTTQKIYKEYSNEQDALQMAEIIAPIFIAIKDASPYEWRNELIDRFLQMSKWPSMKSDLQYIIIELTTFIKENSFLQSDMSFFNELSEKDNYISFFEKLKNFLQIKRNLLKKYVTEQLNFAYQNTRFGHDELELKIVKEIGEDITSLAFLNRDIFKEHDLSLLLNSYSELFSIPSLWWRTLTKLSLDRRLYLSNRVMKFKNLCKLISDRQLTHHHLELFQYINSFKQLIYFLDKIPGNYSAFAKLNDIGKRYPDLFQSMSIDDIFIYYYFLTLLNDQIENKEIISFVDKIIQLILRVKSTFAKATSPTELLKTFVLNLATASSEKLLTEQNIDWLNNVPAKCLFDFFQDRSDNLQNNFEKLSDFNLNDETNFADLFQRYPEEDMVLIEAAFENLTITADQSRDISAQLHKKRAKAENKDDRKVIDELYIRLAMALFAQLDLIDDDNIKKGYYRAILELLFCALESLDLSKPHINVLLKHCYHALYLGLERTINNSDDLYSFLLSDPLQVQTSIKKNSSLIYHLAFIYIQALLNKREKVIETLASLGLSEIKFFFTVALNEETFCGKEFIVKFLINYHPYLLGECLLKAIRKSEKDKNIKILMDYAGIKNYQDCFLWLIKHNQWEEASLLMQYPYVLSHDILNSILNASLLSKNPGAHRFICQLLSVAKSVSFDHEQYLLDLVQNYCWEEATKFLSCIPSLSLAQANTLLLKAISLNKSLFISEIKKYFNPQFDLIKIFAKVSFNYFTKREWLNILLYGLKDLCIQYAHANSSTSLFIDLNEVTKSACHKLVSLLSGIENNPSFDVNTIHFTYMELLQIKSGALKPVYIFLKSTNIAPEVLNRLHSAQDEVSSLAKFGFKSVNN